MLIILILLFFLSGCWDSQELSQRALVEGIGVDIEGDKFKVTCQIVPSEAAKAVLGGTTGGDPNLIWDITTKGKTVADALLETKVITGRDPSFSHTRVLMFSKNAAERGIREALDYFKRNEEIRRRAWIIIADDKIEDILKTQNKLNVIPSTGISVIMETSSAHTDVAAIDLHCFSKKAACSSSCAFAPLVSLRETIGRSDEEEVKSGSSKKDSGGYSEESSKLVDFHETAIFDDFKMIGVLNKKETRGLLLLQNRIKVTAVDIPSPRNPSLLLNVNVSTIKTSIKPQLNNGNLIIDIKVKSRGYINEKHDFNLDISKPEIMSKIGKQLDKTLKEELTMALKKAQSVKADIFDFGDFIYKKHPKHWELIKDNWPQEFQNIDFKIEVNSQINWTGRIDNKD
ncbi:Ger(x)C family spore germination protein [Clostridium sp. 'deep sea']|uniref:Ger(x)C family spore germination protein n=1 Tax=Clostridium sp. 'deep sea' TaxID=2779445 RepID=UPI0018964DA2|nr:Ger(x)C family spore germination protein [Clostridium sp. 'deep sea']QOR36258.1 Ger(x)C family spore germination protein [Clostridium sp. 'deep sea']